MNVEQLRKIKEMYPVGTRIMLIQMNDIQAPPSGTKGTVIGVDDIGSILMRWDNGSSMKIIINEDIFKVIEKYK